MPVFWFVMSLALLVGFITSYPMNWWLVRYHLKHGMMTLRPADASTARYDHATHSSAGGAPPAGHVNDMDRAAPPRPSVPVMALLSFVALATGFALAALLSYRHAVAGRFKLGSPTFGQGCGKLATISGASDRSPS